MTKIDWFSRRTKEVTTCATTTRVARSLGIAVLMMMMVGFAKAQDAAKPDAPQPNVENGFLVHHTVDLGGHVVGVIGSGSMYDTLVNIQSGPRVLGQSLTLHAVPGTKHVLLDSLTAFSNGFGGDPINFAKLDASKGKLYEFTGTFRRDRQYFDYDLLANPNIPPIAQPYGVVAGVPTAASFQFPQQMDSPVMFNTVRRMTDTNLTIFPISKVTFRAGYSGNIFQGPSMSPGRSIGKNSSLLEEYQRNSSDDFTAAVDWKPLQQTKVTFEEFVDHYKADSYFTIAPSEFIVQEADGTPASIGNYDLQTAPSTATPFPYSSAACNTASMGTGYTSATTYTMFTAPNAPGGKPIINAACDVATSYLRLQPTRTIAPTEVLRLQSSSIKNIAFNGDFRYSVGNSTLTNYYENFQGLDGTIRSATITGGSLKTNNGTLAQRRVVSADYGLTWDVSKTFSVSDQMNFSNVHQPGYENIVSNTTLNTPASTTGNATINYSGPLTTGAAFSISGNPTAGAIMYAYFGQKFLTNNATVSWDPSAKFTSAITYRYQTHTVIQTSGTGPSAVLIPVDTHAAILNLSYRPSSKWSNNGSVEISYSDNALTPVEARQLKHYRYHTVYKPRTWATISAAFNDLERHNNTNNTGTPSVDGPLQHVDFNRVASIGLVLAPTEKVSFEAAYSYSDVYTSTNICYFSAATTIIAGTAATNAAGGPALCPDKLTDWGPVKDFMSAPTQFASFGVTYVPNKVLKTGAGYRISAVSGNQLFEDAQQVNGSLQSAYQTPYVNIAYAVRPNWIWRAEYNYYGYGEGGPSGPQFCSTSTLSTTAVVPCTSLALPTGLTEPSSGETAPRNFHANVLTVAMHYEF